MKRLILVTTKGCEACNIMRRLINKALSYDMIQAKSIHYIEMDISDYNKSEFKQKDVKDFPALLFIKNNEVLSTIEGTAPIPHIIEECTKCF